MSSDQTTLPKPFVFVLMPFETAFDDIYRFGIKGAADDVGAYAERVDEQIFTEGILDRIFNQISRADIIVADMTGRNPNVFYEVGYAHALGKIVLLLTQHTNDIPFDLKHRQHTEYGGKIETLRRELGPKIQWAIAESRRRQLGEIPERFSIRLNGKTVTPGITPEKPTQLHGKVYNKSFRLPIHLRNDSVEALPSITHVYLFTPEAALFVPCEYVESVSSQGFPIGSTFEGVYESKTYKKPVAIESFTANPIDAPDGLNKQYRLPVSFPALPPGAIEEKSFAMMFLGDQTEGESKYRLRASFS